MEKSYSSLAELRAEIALLKVRTFQQEEAIKDKFSSPSAVFNSARELFRGNSGKSNGASGLFNHDAFTYAARLAIPLFMNGVFFKKSGFIVKSLVTFLSQKAATQVNSNAVSGIIGKIKGIFKNFGSGKKKTTVVKAPDLHPSA